MLTTKLLFENKFPLHRTAIFLISISIMVSSCVKSPTQPNGQLLPNATIVYIVNQGVFGHGNSSITAYYPDSSKAVTDVFKIVNGRSLGDVGNDIALYHGRAYVVVNNSDKIEVMNASTALSLGTIYFKSGTSPYRIAVDSTDNLGFVSDLYGNSVSVIDLNTNSLLPDSIAAGVEPYGISYASGKIFVANSGGGSGNSVSVIDPSSKKVVSSILVGGGPTEILPDGKGNLWVICPGNYGDIGKVFVINASTYAVVDSMNMNDTLASFIGYSFAVDQERNAAYLITGNSVIKLDLNTRQIVNSNFVKGSFYGISVDAATGNVYVADAKDYQSDGVVKIYTSSGDSTGKSFATGINPGEIAFQR